MRDEVCFVIAPIGSDDSKERRRIDGLLGMIRSVLQDKGINALAAHEIDKPGSITEQIVEYLIDSKIVVADLSDLNPNVMYELAVRHFANKPVITIAEKGTRLPFDIQDQRTIFYENDFLGLHTFSDKFKKTVESSLSDYVSNNPISRVIEGKGKYVPDSDILGRMEKVESFLKEAAPSRVGKPGFDDRKEFMLGLGTARLNEVEVKEACTSFLRELSAVYKIYDAAFTYDLDRQLAAIRIITDEQLQTSELREAAQKSGLKYA